MPESVWLDCEPLEELSPPPWVLSPAERRRFKAILVLSLVWGGVSLLHLFPVTRWGVTGLATLFGIQAIRLFGVVPDEVPSPLALSREAVEGDSGVALPAVSILVPAKNESAVLPQLLASLAQLEYPLSHTEIWVIDDASTDTTWEILTEYQPRMPQLHLHRRLPGAGGGKSGALNEVLPLTSGDVILVCDADALVPPDLLRRSLPLFIALGEARPVGAVQVRKAIINANENFWTGGQQTEMAMDAYVQRQRISIGGVGELRGNGQLVRRDVLVKSGGWNEATLTDDLDLTFKLHLVGVDIAIQPEIAIQEEGVTTWRGLWHQRSRWAEGGYQRFLDYWPGVLGRGLDTAKTWDLWVFFIAQYLMPMALLPDFLWTLTYSHRSALLPLSSVILAFSLLTLSGGLRQIHRLKGWLLWLRTLQGLVYMMHWIPVMIFTTTRLCVQPKRLKWVKTEHRGIPSA